MNKIFFLLLALILVACSTSPQVTVTSTVTITLTPFPTETPLPTHTPEPPIYAEAQEFLGEGFEVTLDGKLIDKTNNKEISGLTIIPFDENKMANRGRPSDPKPTWAIQRIYEFEGKTDFTVNITEYDIKIEGGKIDMFGWVYENGEFSRQKVEFAAPNNGTIEIDGYSPEEVQFMIINNSSTDPRYRINSFQTVRDLSTKNPNTIINREIYFTYKGMFEKRHKIAYFYSNFVPTIDTNNTWSEVETTGFVVNVPFKDRSKAFVVWMGKDNKPVIVIVDGKYLDLPGYFNHYWQTHEIDDSFYP